MDNKQYVNENIQTQNTSKVAISNSLRRNKYLPIIITFIIVVILGTILFSGSQLSNFYIILCFIFLLIFLKSAGGESKKNPIVNNSEINSEQKLNTSEVYVPKINTAHFFFYLLVFDAITFSLISQIIMQSKSSGGFDKLFSSLSLIFFEIVFSILSIISYKILTKKEKDGSKYNILNHNKKYKIILFISLIIFFGSLISAIAYLIPLVKNYQTFKLLESLKNSQYTYWGYLRGMYIDNFLFANYIIIRYILIILSGILIFLVKRKFNIIMVYLLWIMGFIIFSQIFLGLDICNKTYVGYINKINSIINQTEGILEYDKVVSLNDPNLCISIKNERAQFNCKNYFYKISKIK